MDTAIIRPLPTIRRGFQYTLLITERFTKLFQLMLLGRTHLENISQAITEDWVYEYAPPKKLLLSCAKQYMFSLFQCIFQPLEITTVSRLTHYFQNQEAWKTLQMAPDSQTAFLS